MDTEQNDPRKIIFSFLSELPQTIQTEALLFVIIYAIGVDPPNDTKEIPGVVRDYLIRLGILAIGAVICTAAVIDHIFEGQIPRLDSAEAALKLLRGSRSEKSCVSAIPSFTSAAQTALGAGI